MGLKDSTVNKNTTYVMDVTTHGIKGGNRAKDNINSYGTENPNTENIEVIENNFK